MTTVLIENEKKSRWGYHACNYQDFLKIKLLHKHYWLAKYAEAAYNKFYAKQPQNRLIRKSNKILLTNPIPMPVPFFPNIYAKLLKKPIVPAFQQARHPMPTQEHVKPLLISMSQVNELLAEIETAYLKK